MDTIFKFRYAEVISIHEHHIVVCYAIQIHERCSRTRYGRCDKIDGSPRVRTESCHRLVGEED
jgi:hypothetical protein